MWCFGLLLFCLCYYCSVLLTGAILVFGLLCFNGNLGMLGNFVKSLHWLFCRKWVKNCLKTVKNGILNWNFNFQKFFLWVLVIFQVFLIFFIRKLVSKIHSKRFSFRFLHFYIHPNETKRKKSKGESNKQHSKIVIQPLFWIGIVQSNIFINFLDSMWKKVAISSSLLTLKALNCCY